MQGNPGEYRPSLNAPSVEWDEYEAYEQAGMSHVPVENNMPVPPQMPDIDNQRIPGLLPVPQDDMPLEERFLMAMGKRNEIETIPFEQQPMININGQNPDEVSGTDNPASFDTGLSINGEDENPPWLIKKGPAMSAELSPEDVMHSFIDITDALGHLQKVLPPEHPDIVNLKTAMRDILDNPETMSKLETLAGPDRPSKLGQGNPYENDDIIEQVNGPYEHPDMSLLQPGMPVMFDNAEQMEMPFEEAMLHENGYMDEQNLEQVTEDEISAIEQSQFMQDEMMDMGIPGAMEIAKADLEFDDPAAMFDEINQAIDQMIEQPMQEELEPDPFQMQYDPFMAQQYMFNPQYRPDYMAGGPMPLNPDMGFGPTGLMMGPPV
jgi:hypothetical protein